MWEFNDYGLIMAKWNAAHTQTFNGHLCRAVDFEAFAQSAAHFFRYATCFLEKLSFGGPLSFRLKMNNMRGLRSFFKTQNATVLEDYIRLDEEYNMPLLSNQLPDILHTVLHTTAWALGLQMPPDQWNEFITQLLQEIQDVK